MAKKKKIKALRVQAPLPKKQSSQAWTIALIIVSGFVLLIIILVIVDSVKNNKTGNSGQNSQQSAQNYDAEIQNLQTQLNSNPNDVNALVQLGNIYYDSQKWPQAIENYEKSLKISSNDAGVMTDLGTAYFYTSPPQSEKAIELYNKALKLEPGFQNAMLNKGIVLRDGLRKPQDALKVWNEYLSIPDAKEKGRVKNLIEATQNTLKGN